MHQQSRHPPRGGYAAATNPQTNPTRTNNPRDALASRSRAASEAAPPGPSLDGGGGGGGGGGVGGGGVTNAPGTASATSLAVGGPTKESIKKLDQIIQVRMCIVPSRPSRPPQLECSISSLLTIFVPQNFYLKAAVLIVQSRIPVTLSGSARSRKTNKWVGLTRL